MTSIYLLPGQVARANAIAWQVGRGMEVWEGGRGNRGSLVSS